MLRIIFAGVAAIGVGVIAGWTFVAVVPASPPDTSTGVPIAAIAPEHNPSDVSVAEHLEAAASSPETPVVTRETPTTETAAPVTVIGEGQPTGATASIAKRLPATPALPRSSDRAVSPPVILGIRH
jgi:hypothetical protein